MAFLSSRFTGWLVRHKERIKTMGIGLTVYLSLTFAFDWGFYLYAFSQLGVVNGGMFAVGLSFIINALVFWAYDHMKIDWLGAYLLRELQVKANKNRFERLAVWIGKVNKTWWELILTMVAFVLVLARVDPVIVAVHFQQAHFKGLGIRDWAILLIATAVGNTWWLIQIGAAYSVWKWLFY